MTRVITLSILLFLSCKVHRNVTTWRCGLMVAGEERLEAMSPADRACIFHEWWVRDSLRFKMRKDSPQLNDQAMDLIIEKICDKRPRCPGDTPVHRQIIDHRVCADDNRGPLHPYDSNIIRQPVADPLKALEQMMPSCFIKTRPLQFDTTPHPIRWRANQIDGDTDVLEAIPGRLPDIANDRLAKDTFDIHYDDTVSAEFAYNMYGENEFNGNLLTPSHVKRTVAIHSSSYEYQLTSKHGGLHGYLPGLGQSLPSNGGRYNVYIVWNKNDNKYSVTIEPKTREPVRVE